MTQGINRVAAAAVWVAGLALAGAAQAQSAGSIIVRAGATQIKPDVTSGDLTAPSFAGTKADIKADTQPTAGITYMLTDAIALDLPLAAGFKHEIVGAGAIEGVGKIGEVRALPITLLGQYRFLGAKDAFRPFVGFGPTYAKFYKARSTAALTALTGGTPSNPTTINVQSKWAATVQLGATYTVAPGWSVEGTVLKTFLKTRTTLSTGQTLDAKLDPLSLCIGIGYKF
jgi:outer membrane protein